MPREPKKKQRYPERLTLTKMSFKSRPDAMFEVGKDFRNETYPQRYLRPENGLDTDFAELPEIIKRVIRPCWYRCYIYTPMRIQVPGFNIAWPTVVVDAKASIIAIPSAEKEPVDWTSFSPVNQMP